MDNYNRSEAGTQVGIDADKVESRCTICPETREHEHLADGEPVFRQATRPSVPQQGQARIIELLEELRTCSMSSSAQVRVSEIRELLAASRSEEATPQKCDYCRNFYGTTCPKCRHGAPAAGSTERLAQKIQADITYANEHQKGFAWLVVTIERTIAHALAGADTDVAKGK